MSTPTNDAALSERHLLRTHSSSRNGIKTHRAGCSCDPAVKFLWSNRYEQHRAHLDAVIALDAHAAGVAAERARVLGLLDDETVRELVALAIFAEHEPGFANGVKSSRLYGVLLGQFRDAGDAAIATLRDHLGAQA